MRELLFAHFSRLLLEAEAAVEKTAEFEQRYLAATGEAATVSSHYQVQDNKWGVECRMYFDAEAWVVESLRKRGYHVEERSGAGYRGDFSYRINSENLFWKLVDHGYRLGENNAMA